MMTDAIVPLAGRTCKSALMPAELLKLKLIDGRILTGWPDEWVSGISALAPALRSSIRFVRRPHTPAWSHRNLGCR